MTATGQSTTSQSTTSKTQRLLSGLLAFVAVMLIFGAFASLSSQTTKAFADEPSKPITVYIDFEGYNLGQGFYVEPTKFELPAGTNAAALTDKLLTSKGITYTAWGQGAPDFTGFYLSRVNGIDSAQGDPSKVSPPDYITDTLGAGSTDGSLGEFDYTYTSGWMITVNNVLIQTGADQYTLKDGDVVRWQFTVQGLGQDLGLENSWGGEQLYTQQDKSELIRALCADAAPDAAPDAVPAEAKPAALAVVINPTATAAQVSDALAALTPAPAPVFSLKITLASAQAINVYDAADATAPVASATGTSATFSLAAGTYWVEGKDATGSMGRARANVSANTTLTFCMRQYQVTNDSSSWVLGTDFSFAVTDSQGTAYQPGARNNKYMRYIVKSGDKASFSAAPLGTRTAAYMAYTASATYTAAGSVSLALPTNGQVTVTVPAGSTLFLGFKTAHFVPFTGVLPTSGPTDNGDGTVSYAFALTDGNVYNYRVSQAGKVTYTNMFTVNASAVTSGIKVAQSKLDAGGKTPSTIVRDLKANSGYNVADLYLNINPQGYKQMQVGEQFQIVSMRDWQTVDSVTNNYFVEPDYHYSVVGLDGSPITVSADGKITANSDGTALVLVTYDAITFDGAQGTDKFYGAIWPENTGVFVVSVGGAGDGSGNSSGNDNGSGNSGDGSGNDNGSFDTGMVVPSWYRAAQRLAGSNLDSEHDVIYYNANADGAYYSFTPAAGSQVSILRPTVTDTAMTFSGGFTTDGVSQADGTYTVRLTEGRDIVQITNNGQTQYQVITAKKATVTVTDTTSPSGPVMPGDKVTVVFKTLYHPANKLAGVYNFTMQLAYDLPDGTTVRGTAAQYNFASTAGAQTLTFTVPKDFTGSTYTLTGGRIGTPASGIFYGDPIGSHRTITYDIGRQPNLSAIQIIADMTILPDISIPVGVDAGPALAAAKALKIAEINGVLTGLHGENYTPDSWAALQSAIASALGAVDAATTVDAVNAIAAPDSASILVAMPVLGGPGTGDLNADGAVTMDEAMLIAQIVAGDGAAGLTPAQFAAVDMDNDGSLTMADVMLMLRAASASGQ